MNSNILNERILVLGGTGFLGSHIVSKLSQEGFLNVFSAARNIDPRFYDQVNNIKLDILNYQDVLDKIQSYSILINCVGQISNPINNCFVVNTLGLSNLTKAALYNNVKVIHLSTVSVYGTSKKVTEHSPVNPETPYAACKAFAEYTLLSKLNNSKLSILRLSNVYGDNTRNGLIPYLINAYSTGSTIKINNDGSLFRYYLHIDDLSNIISEFIKKGSPSGIFNISGKKGYTIKKLIKLFSIKMNKKVRVLYEPYKPVENIEEIDISKIRKIIAINYLNSLEGYLDKITNEK